MYQLTCYFQQSLPKVCINVDELLRRLIFRSAAINLSQNVL